MSLGVLGTLVVVADQVSKWLVTQSLEVHQSIPLVPDVLYLTHVQNPGAAFGLFANQTVVFITATLLAIGLAVLYRRRIAAEAFAVRFGMAIALSGAIGNFLDRVRTGHVIDFLDLRWWPVFNLADVAIVAGVSLLLWTMLRAPDSEPAHREAGSGEGARG